MPEYAKTAQDFRERKSLLPLHKLKVFSFRKLKFNSILLRLYFYSELLQQLRFQLKKKMTLVDTCGFIMFLKIWQEHIRPCLFPARLKASFRPRTWPSNPLLPLLPSLCSACRCSWEVRAWRRKVYPVVRAACLRVNYALTIRNWLMDLEVGLYRRLRIIVIYLNFIFCIHTYGPST